jgi:mutator protein MutT
VWRDGEVLLVKRGRQPLAGLWSLPGGMVELGEAAEGAALRELAEETGVAAKIAGLADLHEIIHHDANNRVEAHFAICVFAARWLRGEPVAADDAADARWVVPSDLARLELTPGSESVITGSARFLTRL